MLRLFIPNLLPYFRLLQQEIKECCKVSKLSYYVALVNFFPPGLSKLWKTFSHGKMRFRNFQTRKNQLKNQVLLPL